MQVTGLLRIPAAVTAGLYEGDGYRVLSLVVHVRASPVPRPDGKNPLISLSLSLSLSLARSLSLCMYGGRGVVD
jgi:hypothetical protein